MKRSIADFKAVYSATRSIDVNVSLRSAAKTGNQPWGGTFGFGDAVDLAAPVQTRTTDLGLGVDWGGFGVYVAKAVNASRPLRLTARLEHRF